jgi:hypothetical protein
VVEQLDDVHDALIGAVDLPASAHLQQAAGLEVAITCA